MLAAVAVQFALTRVSLVRQQIFVCGLAADFCVAFTAKDGAKAGYNTFFIEDASKGISEDGCEKARTEMDALGVHQVALDHVPERAGPPVADDGGLPLAGAAAAAAAGAGAGAGASAGATADGADGAESVHGPEPASDAAHTPAAVPVAS